MKTQNENKEKCKGKVVEMTFRNEITSIINKYSKENGSDTPDWILAHFVEKAIEAFDHATNLKTEYFACKPM